MQTNKIVFLAGANKSGTTTLFGYLGEHSSIAPSLVKQPGFFLHSRSFSPSDEGAFKKLFAEAEVQSGKILLEGTPDYLSNESAANNISQAFGREPKFIFILRDPIDRCKSWFKYGKQSGKVNPNQSFGAFLSSCEEFSDSGNCKEPYSALQTGFYSSYLQAYYDLFPRQNIFLCDFQQLKKNPRQLLQELAEWLGIEIGEYEHFVPVTRNTSVRTKNNTIRRIYVAGRNITISMMKNNEFMARLMAPAIPVFMNAYRRLNTSSAVAVEMDSSTERRLQSRYVNDGLELEKRFGFKASWCE